MIRGVQHVTLTGIVRNENTVFISKDKTLGRPTHRCEDNIKMDF
jgi:hypothetical protein